MRRFTLLVVSLMWSLSALAWGQKGHDVVACIAERHLTPAAAANLAAALGGRSAVYYSNWMDNASHTDEYSHTLTWHYANVDEGYTFATMPRNTEGDIVSALEMLIAELEQGGLEPERELLDLKMVIHLVGDLHCPMHTGRKSDRGGNDRPVWFFSKSTNLHSIWDTDLVEAAHKWSYTEWCDQIDRPVTSEPEVDTGGSIVDWFGQTQEICTEIYAATPVGTRVSFDYIARYAPVIERQLLRGGLRLAALLNRIYDR